MARLSRPCASRMVASCHGSAASTAEIHTTKMSRKRFGLSSRKLASPTRMGSFNDAPRRRRAMSVMNLNELRVWSETVADGDYLAEYAADDLDEVSDPGSRCGYDDA